MNNLTSINQVAARRAENRRRKLSKIVDEIHDLIVYECPAPFDAAEVLHRISIYRINLAIIPPSGFGSFGKEYGIRYKKRRRKSKIIEFRIVASPGCEQRRPNVSDELRYFDNTDDADYDDDDELGYFGITVKKTAPPCPYNEKGEYVPRSRRREYRVRQKKID